MKDANDLCLRNEAIEYSLEELIDSITADDLCDVQDGTFTKVYEEYGLEMFKAGSSLKGKTIEEIINFIK